MRPGDPNLPQPPVGVREQRLESHFPEQSEIEVSWIDEAGRVKTGAATVIDQSEHGLGLKASMGLPAGLMVWMRGVDGELVKAAVLLSESSETGDWQVRVRAVPREQRAYAREPVRGAAELKWPGTTGRSSSIVVQVVDLSDGGAGVIAAQDLPRGQIVQLIGDQFECFCSVRNGHDLADGSFRLGLIFAREPYDRLHSLAADWVD